MTETRIDTQTEGLKAMANAYFASAGIKVNWYINENPDQEIMTG